MEMQVGFRRGGSLTSKTNCPFKALVQVKLYIKEKRRKCFLSPSSPPWTTRPPSSKTLLLKLLVPILNGSAT